MTEPYSSKISLLGPLSAVLPSPEQTQLLRACLWSDKPGAQAWREWSREIVDPAGFLRQEKDGVKGLLPLLFDSLQHNNVPVVEEFRTYLRTAYLRDELRSKTYGRICRNVVETLTKAGLPALVLKGAALAELGYKSPTLQHAHYLDVLIRACDLNRAVEVLRTQNFAGVSAAPGSEWQDVELVHESGLPLVLHRSLFRFPFYSVNMEEFWARSQTEMVYGAPTRVLSPSDYLFHICGSVFDVERHESLRWVCDAWFLIQRFPNLDWDLLLECACQSRMVFPLSMTAGYLAESLSAPIPASFLLRLHAAALKAQPIEREAALFAVQTHARGGLKKIMQNCDDWPSRAFVLKWALLPSPNYMLCVYEIPSAFLLPLYYLYRPLRYLSVRPGFVGGGFCAGWGKGSSRCAPRLKSSLHSAIFQTMSIAFAAMSNKLRPEDELLLRCARTDIDSDTMEEIHTLLQGSLDWEYLVGTASKQGVKPLLCSVLSQRCPKRVPKPILDQLRRYLQIHSLNNLFLTRELIRLFGALEKVGISAIPWKGPVLAAAAYGDVALRQFADLDILVREQDATRAKNLLLSAGYRLRYQGAAENETAFHSARQVCELVREDDRTVVELHWAITSGTFYFPLDPASLWERVETVSLEGTPVRNLCPEDLLLVLCVHGAKHHWGRLLWICDIAELLRVNSKKIDWTRFRNRASALGGWRMLCLGMLLAHDLLEAKVPEDVLQRMQAEPKAPILAAEVRSWLFAGGPLMAVERPTFYVQLRERAQDRMRCRLYLGYRMMAPRAQAWALRLAHSGRSVLRYLS